MKILVGIHHRKIRIYYRIGLGRMGRILEDSFYRSSCGRRYSSDNGNEQFLATGSIRIAVLLLRCLRGEDPSWISHHNYCDAQFQFVFSSALPFSLRSRLGSKRARSKDGPQEDHRQSFQLDFWEVALWNTRWDKQIIAGFADAKKLIYDLFIS